MEFIEKAALQSKLKGKTPEQQEVIKYFYTAGGCGAKTTTDERFDEIVKNKLNSLDTKKRALGKIGLDEDELKEIPPVFFHGFEFDGALTAEGSDGRSRSSKYSATWLFFNNSQVFMYSILFDLASDSKNERTEEYFYKDITNFSTSNASIELTAFTKAGGCSKKESVNKKTAETSMFALIVPGDKFSCSTSGVANADQAVQAMKQKLREKKNA